MVPTTYGLGVKSIFEMTVEETISVNELTPINDEIFTSTPFKLRETELTLT